MLANFSLQLFNRDKVITFRENQYDLSTYPKRSFDKELSVNHFMKSVLRYEKNWNHDKFNLIVDETKNDAIFSYLANNDTMKYVLVIHY